MDPMQNLNNAADALNQVAQRAGGFWDDADAQMAQNQALFDAWRSDRDVLGDPNLVGASRIAVLQGQVSGTGGTIAAGGVGDFANYDLDAGASSNVYLHLDTGLNINDDVGYFGLHVTGYSYGSSQIIDAKAAGHTWPPNNALLAGAVYGTNNVATYSDATGKAYMRLLFPSTYITTLRVDAQFMGATWFQKGDITPIFSTQETL